MVVGSHMNANQIPIRPLLDACCDEALVYRDLSKVTIQWWSNTTRFFMRATGAKFMDELTAERVRRFFFDGRTKRRWSATTYINNYRALNAFLKWCVKKGHLETNPLNGLETPRPAKRIPRSISEEDARLLLDASFNMPFTYRFVRYRNHAFMSLLLFTGLRLSEALHLGIADVNLEENHVFVRSGKWNKDRVVPLLPDLRRSVRSYLKERERLKKNCPRFFASLRGDAAFTASGVKRTVLRLREVTKIKFTPHMLRHTFCTMMANAGTDLLTLQGWMGHSSIETTMRYITSYGHRSKTEIFKHPLSNAVSTGRRPA